MGKKKMPLVDQTTQLKQERDVFVLCSVAILIPQMMIVAGIFQMIPGYGYHVMSHDNLELAFICFVWGGAAISFGGVMEMFAKWLIPEEKKNG